MKYKICFSIPCHESSECVEDLIWNIRFFAPCSAVVLHANANSGERYYEELKELEARYPFVLVNDERFPVQWGDGALLNTYVSNYAYARARIEFDKYWLDASNSLIVNRQIEEVADQYDCALTYAPISPDTDWCWTPNILGDQVLKSLSDAINEGRFKPYGGPIEGSFFSPGLFDKVYSVLSRFQSTVCGGYPKEETYVHTVVAALSAIGQIPSEKTTDICCLREFDPQVLEMMKAGEFDLMTRRNVCTMKRFDRKMTDPNRTTVREYIRGLGACIG